MKFIRASERVPDHYRLVHLQYNNADKIFSKTTARYNPSMGHWITLSGFELKDCTDIKWLDETPPALPTDLKQEAERLYPYDATLKIGTTEWGVDQELTDMQRAAYLAAASHFQERVKELEGEVESLKETVAHLTDEYNVLQEQANKWKEESGN